MRTTLAIDDVVFEQLKRYANSRSLSMGQAATSLIRRGLNSPLPTRKVHGLTVFELPPDAPRVTTERVKELEAEG
jgi:hypothetical protein